MDDKGERQQVAQPSGCCIAGEGRSVRGRHQCSTEFDVVIIGSGVVGSSIARELSKYHLNVAMLEKCSDVSQGSTKANSGIVHGGYDAKHGTLKSKLSHKGNSMYPQLEDELRFGFKQIGSLVLAFNTADEEKLQELYDNGMKNGVKSIRLIDREEILSLEPNVSLAAHKALYCPDAGIASPYELTYALCENAMHNGVNIFLDQKVVAITKNSLTGNFLVETSVGDVFHAKRVINCAGLFADDVSKMAKAESFEITPRKGEYVILNRMQGKLVRHVLFQAPTAKWGKGILVSPTVAGNLMLGPSAIEVSSKYDTSTSVQELAYVAWSARRTIPTLEVDSAITSYAGLRARSSTRDFIIEESKLQKGFINVAGIESPGLTSSPAIAEMVRDLLITSGLALQRKASFDPSRRAIRVPKGPDFDGTTDDHPDPTKHIICRCEKVTEAEIVDALHRGIPITSTDQVKWRTRAGMGNCQGNFCQPRVAALIKRELNLDSSPSKELNGREDNIAKVRVMRTLLSKL